MCCSSGKLVLALFLIMLFCRSSRALAGDQNCSSWCGDHNVSSPFRLQDSAEECGDKRYNLTCEQNQLVMNSESGRYIVLSINYDNYTIRVRDANIVESADSSSVPEYSLTDYNFSLGGPYTSSIQARNENGDWQWHGMNTNMIYVRCENPVDSPGLVDTATCFITSNASVLSSSSSSWHSYVHVDNGYGGVMVNLEKDDCVIEMMYMTSWPAALKNNQPWSCTDIQSMLVYGFELSWLNSFCPDSGEYYEIILGGKEPRCQIEFVGSVQAISIMPIVGLWGIQIEPNDGPPMNEDEGEETDELEVPQQPYPYPQDIPNNADSSAMASSSSDISVNDYKETTSFSTQEDGTST